MVNGNKKIVFHGGQNEFAKVRLREKQRTFERKALFFFFFNFI